jgi:hypothetical protein
LRDLRVAGQANQRRHDREAVRRIEQAGLRIGAPQRQRAARAGRRGSGVEIEHAASRQRGLGLRRISTRLVDGADASGEKE